MKKLILFAAILFTAISVVNAQNVKPNYVGKGHIHSTATQGVNKTASTDLNVILNSIQSISVNTSSVTLEYTTVDDYTKGVNSGFIADHLEVYSTGSFGVKVHYLDPTSNYENGDATAASLFNTIQVVAENNGYKFLSSKTAGLIVDSNKGGFGLKYNVDYRGKGDFYRDYIGNGQQRTFKATVVYTIEPK